MAVVGGGFAVVPGEGLVVVGLGPGGSTWAPACQITAAANAAAVVSTTPAARQRDLTLCRSPRLS